MSFSDSCEEHDVVNQWLRLLGARVQVELKLDADGLCAIGHLSGIDCALEVPEGCGKVYLRAPLLSLDRVEYALLRFCMKQHLLGIGTCGNVFAIDEKDHALVLWLARDLAGLDLESFAMMVVDFFDASEHWKFELEGWSAQKIQTSQLPNSNQISAFALRA